VFEIAGTITDEQISALDEARNTFYDLEWQYNEAQEFVRQQEKESLKMDYEKRQMHLNKMKTQKAQFDQQVKDATKRLEKLNKDKTGLEALKTKQQAPLSKLSGEKLDKQNAAIF